MSPFGFRTSTDLAKRTGRVAKMNFKEKSSLAKHRTGGRIPERMASEHLDCSWQLEALDSLIGLFANGPAIFP